MTEKSYTETLAELNKTIADLIAALTPLRDEDAVTLGEIYRRQGDMISLQREMNGTVKGNSEALVALAQWKEDHEETHGGLKDEIKYINRKFNVVGTIEGILASLGIIVSLGK